MPAATHFLQLQASFILLARRLPSRTTVNDSILAAGIALQCALVGVIFLRGVARRFPGFAALLIFYTLRAGSLFLLVRYLDADAYRTLFRVLEAVEVLLEIWVGAEIVKGLLSEQASEQESQQGRRTQSRAAILVLLPCAALGLTWGVASMLPQKQLADRVQMLAWFLMLALFAAAWKAARSKSLVRIPAGFAAFAVFQFAALAGRMYATAHHATGAYILWSYVPACGYLAVLIYWIGALRTEETTVRRAAAACLPV